MYHILDTPRAEQEAKYCCPPGMFAEQMACIAESHSPISLDMMLDGLNGQADLAENAIAVTFDDGFVDTFEHAMPVLEKFRIPATMFIVGDRLGAYNDWMAGKPQRMLMDAGQIQEMHAANVTIGSHTLTHPRLPECTPERMTIEIGDSKSRIEQVLSHPVHHFAYPYGLYNDFARNQVREAGYLSACSTRSGFNNSDTDRFELHRIEVYGNDGLRQLRQKLKFGTNDASWLLPARYYFGRALARVPGF